MKILAICQYYYPEPVRFNDICEELTKRGHEVDVITDFPNYPMGKLYKGYKNKFHYHETINGINIERVYTVPRGKNILGRFLNYFSFAISSSIYASFIKKDYDVVFVNQLSPVMMISSGIKYKKKHGKKLVTYCLDIWPESLKVGGIKENSIIFKMFKYISKKCLKIVYENIYFAIGIKILCLILGALGIANMWMAIFADVGVMIIAVLNAIRTLFVKNL